MSDQLPYQSHGNPVAQEDGQLPGRPTIVSVIAIICMLLGALALLYACLQAVGMVMSEAFADMLPDQETREQTLAINKIQFIPNILQLFVGAIAAPLMIVGAIGVLIDKAWGWSGLKLALIGFILWNILIIGSSIYMLLFHFDLLSGPSIAQFGEESGTSMVWGINIGMMVMFGLFILLEAGLLFVLGRNSSKQWLNYLRGQKPDGITT